MANKILVLILSFTLFISCKKISLKDLTVIDDIKLGMNEDAFNSQLDSLHIKQEVFYTKVIFTNLDEVDNDRVNCYYTDIFNNSKYSSSISKTYGIYYPTNWAGTKNIIGLIVLLVHTDNAIAMTSNGYGNITKESKISGISQNLSVAQTDDIAQMLSNKYGKPLDTSKFEFTTFFVFQGNQIKDYRSDSNNVGELLTWKTKCFDIKYFKGIASTESVFNSKENTYFSIIDKTSTIDYNNGERPCRSYSYIIYQLNDETIKKLQLDKPKL